MEIDLERAGDGFLGLRIEGIWIKEQGFSERIKGIELESWKELEVWQKAHSLVLEIYKLTAKFPNAERFRLTDQLCRAASSIPANIVEGQARQTTKEYIHFLYNARGSLEETRYHLLLAKDLQLLDSDTYATLETDYRAVSKMLNGLIQSLKRKEKRRGKAQGVSKPNP